jgi:hypothetical protein
MKFVKSLSSIFLATLSGAVLADDVATSYGEQDISVQSRTPQQAFFVDETKPDTTGLWFHISQQQLDLAEQEFERLTALHPQWIPEPDLVDAMERLAHPVIVVDKPSEKVDPQAQLFAKMSRGMQRGWGNTSDTEIELASELAFSERNPEHHSLMGWVLISRQDYAKAIAHFNEVKRLDPKHASADDGIQKAVADQTKRAIEEGYPAVLDDLTYQYPQFDIKNMIETTAWEYFKQRRYQAALHWFEYTGNYPAQVTSLDKAGRRTEALELACKHTAEADLLNYCLGYYSEKQALFFDRALYRESVMMAEKIKQHLPLSKGQLELYAWSHYHLSHRTESQLAFAELSEFEPENETYAEILVGLHTIGSPELNRLEALYPRVADEVKRVQQYTAWQRKQFDRSRSFDEASTVKQQVTVESGLAYRSQSSDDALANLNVADYYVGFSQYYDQYKYGIRVNYRTMDSNNPGADDWIGQTQLTSAYDGDTLVKETGLSVYVKRQSEDLNTLFELEYMHPDEGLGSNISAKLSAVWFGDQVVLGSTIFKQRIEDSYLSYSGLIDGDWGAVSATGIKSLVSYEFQPDWAISLEGEAALLSGTNVADNDKLAIEFGLTHDMAKSYKNAIDYLRIGPYVRWMSYDENQNDYTLGNGGYFSPENYLNLGGRAEVLTLENKQWQLRSMIELSYSAFDAGNIERLRDTDDHFVVFQNSESGFGANIELEGQWLIDMNWVLAGLVKQAISESYQQTEVGLQLRWNLDGKQGLTSDELILSSPYRADYAWY